MTIRRGILTGCTLTLVLAACAGTADDTVAPDAPVAAADDAAVEEDAVAEDVAATDVEDDAATATDESTDDHADDAAGDDHADDAADDDHADDAVADDHTDDAVADDHETEDLAAAEDVDRVVEIDMEDIAFSTDELQFAVGERVLFRFENVGAAPHEALIGDMHVQEEHEAEMAQGGGHHDGGHHGDLSMITLEAGESGSFVHEFTEEGELWMGCHVPGHWGAGMKTRIVVTG